MRTIIFTLFLLFSVACLAQVHDPTYWKEGRIKYFRNIIDDDERTCGQFLQCGAAVHIKFDVDYWYQPDQNIVDPHVWKVKAGSDNPEFYYFSEDIPDSVFPDNICDFGDDIMPFIQEHGTKLDTEYEWANIIMPRGTDNSIYYNGYLELLAEGCMCGFPKIAFSFWNGKIYRLLLIAVYTNELCGQEFVFTHRPPERVKQSDDNGPFQKIR